MEWIPNTLAIVTLVLGMLFIVPQLTTLMKDFVRPPEWSVPCGVGSLITGTALTLWEGLTRKKS